MEKGSGGCSKGLSETVDGVKGSQGEKKFTPPEFVSYNPETQLIFPPSLQKYSFKPLAFGNKRKRWYRPVTLQQLLEIKSVHPSAKIIGGSTETQIEIKFKAMNYDASVYVGDIPELRQYSLKDDYVELGANVSLTDLETVCDEAVERYGSTRGQPFTAIKKQIRYFAGRQIRNVASPAGNIATASPISDLNPVFVASKTTLVAKSLDDEVEIPMDQFFKGYRKTALPDDAVVASLRIPVAQEEGEFLRAYKQAKRKDDDIAIVNAAFRVTLSSSHMVMSASLVYGGMAPMTVSARKAESSLVGKKWTDPATLEDVMNSMESDFNLQFSVPGGMATYRKTLALGFFYRFYHDVTSSIEVSEAGSSTDVTEEIERTISFGKKDHTAAVAYEQNVLGKASPHVSAMKQCTGEAQYTDDIPPMKNELYGCLVLSSKAHAKILEVDYSAALEIPGVFDYIDKKDLPDPKANQWGVPVADEVFFAEGEVHTVGQPIGMIIATSAHIAELGSRAVKVEYEELPAILTIEEAIEAKSYLNYSNYVKKGNPEDVFAKSDHVFTGEMRMGGQEHFYLETQACVVIPKPEDGEVEVWCSTQNPAET